ncbi:protein kinase domain-containing protein [Pirellulaceae bacterium SH449]
MPSPDDGPIGRDDLSPPKERFASDLSTDRTNHPDGRLSPRESLDRQALDNHSPAKGTSAVYEQATILRSLERVADSRYEVFEEIGRGGMGLVFRVRDKRLQRDVAMKVISPNRLFDSSYTDRFIEEAQISGQLQHPAIVPIYDIGKLESGHLFFTMKLVKGETLANLLRQRSSLTERLDHWIGIFSLICQAVAFAHSKNVIHRDLKPSNVMVGRFGEVHVMDWGLAKVHHQNSKQVGVENVATDLNAVSNVVATRISPSIQAVDSSTEPDSASSDSSQGQSLDQNFFSVIQTIRHGLSTSTETDQIVSSEYEALTEQGSVLGTVAYMPPEQAAGENVKVDCRSDVFSLGAILCEIATGLPPYPANDKAESIRMAIQGDLQEAFVRIKASPIESEFQSLVKDCLSPSPENRPASAGVLSSRLEEIIASGKERVRLAERENAAAKARWEEAKRTHAAEKRNQRMILLASLVSLGLVVSLVVGGVLLKNRESLRLSQNRLALEQFRAPAISLVGTIWEASVMPPSTDFTRLAELKVELELAISQLEIDLDMKYSIDDTLQRIEHLHHARGLILELDRIYWEYNPFAGVYDPERLMDGTVSKFDRNRSVGYQLKAYERLFEERIWNRSTEKEMDAWEWQSLPPWVRDEMEVGLMRFDHLCRYHLQLSNSSPETEAVLSLIQMELDRIRLDFDLEKKPFAQEVWQAIFQRDVPGMMKWAQDPRVDELSISTRQALAKGLVDNGPDYNAELLRTSIEWILVESVQANDKNIARRGREGSVMAFDVMANIGKEDLLAIRLDTFHDFESEIGPGETYRQLPTDENKCLLDELIAARQSFDGEEFTELEITRAVSGHPIIPGREITNFIDNKSGTFWSVTHQPDQPVASSYFFFKPLRTVKYPFVRIRVDNGHPEFRQLTTLGKYRFFYANRIPELEDAVGIAESLVQRVPTGYLLAPRVQMTLAEIKSMTSSSDLDTAISTASIAYRQSPADTWMAELFLRMVARLPLDAQNAWFTEIQRNLKNNGYFNDPGLVQRKLGAHYSRLGDEFFEIWHQKSLVMYQQAYEVDPNGFKRYGRLGERLRRVGKVDEAKSTMENGVKQAPEVGENWYYLGEMIFNLGEFKRSAFLFEQSVKRDPNDVRFRKLLCQSLLKADRLMEALEFVESLQSRKEIDDHTLSMAVIACFQLKDIDRALSLIEWWELHRNEILNIPKDPLLPMYYDAYSTAWYHICLAAIEAGFIDAMELSLAASTEQFSMIDPRIKSLFGKVISDSLMDWETVFAMMDRVLYGREPLEPAERLENLQKFLMILKERIEPQNRIWVRWATVCVKAKDWERVRSIVEHLPRESPDPYSAFRDILSHVLDDKTHTPSDPGRFIFPSDRTMRLPARDRDLAEWLWWDRDEH